MTDTAIWNSRLVFTTRGLAREPVTKLLPGPPRLHETKS
jgi:hypothetical protein